MFREKLINNEIYHIYNRGIEKRDVFLDNDDYYRFIHDLFEFNDIEPAINLAYYLKQQNQSKEVGLPKIERMPRKLIVEVMAFCLMPNHFHLIVRQKKENGITEFMRKLGTGYTNYFNKKYKRVGVLFQGKYKFIRLTDEAHFVHIPYYIHLNPLDLNFFEWRKRELKNYKSAMKFLENYKWSSHLDYAGIKNFPSVTQREFLLEFFGGPEKYKKSILEWLRSLDIDDFKEFALD
jgi:putative transposase